MPTAHLQSGRGPSATCHSSETYSNKCKTHERVGGEALGQDRVVRAPTSNDANTALVVRHYMSWMESFRREHETREGGRD